MFLDLPILVDQLDLHMLIPDYFMVFQDFGPVGDVSGTGNVMISVFSEATNDWTPAQALMPAGSVMTNVTATAFNGALHSVHFDAGPATASAVLAGPPDVGYKIHDTKLEPDAAIRSCELSQPFASPGSPVSGVVEIENLGFVSTPYHETTGGTAVGLQIVFIDQLGQHIVMQEHPIDILRPGEVQTIEIEVEMPHDPVMIQARLFPNPIDRDRSNDERTCFFGAPAPENLMCSIVETVLDDDVSEVGARLEWDNPALYDMILVYRDGGMIRSLPGNCSVFTDIHVDFGLHRYDVRGVIAASKSAKTGLECIVDPPPPTFRFLRGDTNVDGDVSLADAIVLLNHVFDSDQPLPCLAGGDTNFDGNVNIADAIWLLSYLFTGGEPPADPFPTCGESSEDTDSALGCDEEGC